jgi:hypothetical protein
MEEHTMDVICTCCGEPWDIYHVLHEEPQGFDREGALIKGCPCCHGRQPEDLNRRTRDHLRTLAKAARLFGEDIDRFAAFLEDMLLMY